MNAEIKKIKSIISVALITLLFGCSTSFDKIQNGKVIIMDKTLTVKNLIETVAGEDGDVQWVIFNSEENKKRVTCYLAIIQRKPQRIHIQFMYKPERNVFNVTSMIINGIPLAQKDINSALINN
jgi:hypothetical protein